MVIASSSDFPWFEDFIVNWKSYNQRFLANYFPLTSVNNLLLKFCDFRTISKIVVNINDPSWKPKCQKYANIPINSYFISFDKTVREINKDSGD